jgi:putative nucleotidyltransferase-like protein
VSAHDRAAAFLVAAAREPEPGDVVHLRRLAAAVTDWQTVVSLATRHGLAAYASRWAGDASVAVPTAARDALHAAELAGVATTLALDGTLARVVDAFRARGIDALVLKGPVLAWTIYPQPSLRPYGDIDLVIRSDRLADGVAALLEMGFRELPSEAEDARLAFSGAGGDAPFQRMFVDRSGRSLVELHVDSLQLGIVPRAEEERWGRAVPCSDLPAGALALGEEDMLVQLCLHAQKHGFDRLIWLKDLDLFVRRRGEALDWQVVASIARREGVAASVWFALSLARSCFGTPRTPAVALAPAIPIRLLYELVWPRRRVRSLRVRMRRRAVQFHAAESWRGMVPSIVLMGRRRDRIAQLARALRAFRGRSTNPQPRPNAARTS